MMLKVPVFWVWILGLFVVIAGLSLSYFGQREAETGPGKYKVGTCLRNESLGLVTQVTGTQDGQYILKVLVSRKFPDNDLYRVKSEQKRPILQVDESSAERAIPCP